MEDMSSVKQGCRLQVIVFLAVLSMAAGCGGGSGDKATVPGRVSFEGAPVDEGEILLVPKSSTGRVSTGQIRDGKYLIPEKFGPLAGEYVVQLKGYRPVPVKKKNPYAGDSQSASKQYLPPKYNADSTLTLEIEGGGAVEKDFELTLKP